MADTPEPSGSGSAGRRPTKAELDQALAHVAIAPITHAAPVIDELLARFRQTHCNAGALFAAFEIGAEPALDWYIGRNRLHRDDVLARLLVHPAIRAGLPDLKIDPSPLPDIEFEPHDGQEMEALLARILYHGGAYWHATGSGMPEKALALRFCDALFGLRFDEIAFHTSDTAWTDWFHDIAWDKTFVVLDKRHRRLFLLAVTDTD
ncbi:hypothetical protein FZC33_28125 [Labrys sp. KNU-23]|uniref:hypothetical protein n=1 Tax=Labrys sp. KNU-23 TaxID=2789216 RepID=UPI0011ED0B3F|nr:hypothetical protein [Labrys sp. KNU-23]QEN89941.1 hypothetical protein FZC33_28125 [Labrys sp. KNU-23]